MVRLEGFLVLVCAVLVARVDCKKTFGEMFHHKHKAPLPFLISGWEPDTNSWDESLYPSFTQEFKRRYGKPRVRVTSDSPAMNGSCLTFTAKLEFPRCQKEDFSGNLEYGEHCVNADGQVVSGSVYNWTSWLDDYGFGRCRDLKRCNVFPDGKPFRQHSDWRRRGYVYVWHTMGQYFETCDGSSSSLTLNTTNWTLGAGVMEVMVYRKRERRTFIPLSTDSTVFSITDQIPLFVNISQKDAANITEKNVFIKGHDITFTVQVHDPSSYLRTADTVDFIWDFGDGNQLITPSNTATHAYETLGNVTVRLIVKAAFRTRCPPPTPPPSPPPTQFTLPYTVTTPPPSTSAGSPQAETTQVMTTPLRSTELVPTAPERTTDVTPSSTEPPLLLLWQHSLFTESECFRYIYGNFEDQIILIEPPSSFHHMLPNRISLALPRGLASSTTTVTIGDSPDNGSSGVAEAALTTSAALLAVFAFVVFLVYKRYKVYRPMRRPLLENASRDSMVSSSLSRFRAVLFPANEERSRLLTDQRL